jgi:hypothetical protein
MDQLLGVDPNIEAKQEIIHINDTMNIVEVQV